MGDLGCAACLWRPWMQRRLLLPLPQCVQVTEACSVDVVELSLTMNFSSTEPGENRRSLSWWFITRRIKGAGGDICAACLLTLLDFCM